MSSIIPIENADDPRISIYRSLKGKDLETDGVFIAEGDKVFQELLNTDLEILSVLVDAKWLERFREQIEARAIKVYVMPQEAMKQVVGFHMHQGLMAAVKAPVRIALEESFKSWRQPYLILAIDGVKDAENVGVIVRNAAAFGVDAIMLDKNSFNPYIRRAVRVSLGTIFRIPVIYADCLPQDLKRLKQEFKTRVIVAAPDAGNKAITELELSGNVCLVFGSEDYGVSEAVRELADSIVRIPIVPNIDSLNVNCASAVFLHYASAKRKVVS